jgi:hypothetical protein
MQPFRKGSEKKSATTSGKCESAVHVVPYIKGLRMMSDREATEVAQHGEVLRWSSDSDGEDEGGASKTDCNVVDEVESEEPTEFGVIWERFVVPETNACDIERKGDESDGRTERDEVHGNGLHGTIEARKEQRIVVGEDELKTSTTSASPCIEDFESFLERRSQVNIESVFPEGPMIRKPKTMSNNEFWQGVLESEQHRLSKDLDSRKVAVEEILLGGDSEEDAEDNIPIVSQLPKKFSFLAALAAVPNPSPKQRKKKVPKSLWTYETVAEPTGAASRYWDAPSQRTTKLLAKQRLEALREAEITSKGQ